jgi:hypothetical protein
MYGLHVSAHVARAFRYGCDADITHGVFEVIAPSHPEYDASASACKVEANKSYASTAVFDMAVATDASQCCAACGATVGCYSWSYAAASQDCYLRSAPLNGVGVDDVLFVSGQRAPAQGKTTCDLGWTGDLCQKRDLYSPSTGLRLPAYVSVFVCLL